MANRINGFTFGSSSVRIRWHLSAFGVTKFAIPEVTMKEEQIVLIGDQTPSFRTPGILEIGKGTATFIGATWMSFLEVLPDHYMDVEFPITLGAREPTIRDSYGCVLDRCRITKHKINEISNDEKAWTHDIEISCMNVLQRAGNSGWKCAGLRPGELAPATQALLRF